MSVGWRYVGGGFMGGSLDAFLMLACAAFNIDFSFCNIFD